MTYKQHHEIIEATKRKHPNFGKVFDEYGADIEAIWERLDDPAMMLDMFEESNYCKHYLEELVDFARWLRGKVQTANSGDFDRWLSKVNLGIKTDLEKGMLSDDQADQRRLDLISIDAKKSIKGARLNAEDRRRAAEMLRELMPYPFLPKVP